MGLSARDNFLPTEDPLPRLIDAMDAQVRLLLELESMRLNQRAAIEDDEPSRLLTLLEARQHVIDSLTNLDREIAGLRGQVESRGSRVSSTQRDEISRRATVVAQAIQRILLGDADDGEVLERRRTQIAGELSGLKESRRAVSAYRPPGTAKDGPGAMFQDRSA